MFSLIAAEALSPIPVVVARSRLACKGLERGRSDAAAGAARERL